ncbi:MAG: hypothetical protein ABJL67_09770 [Sulfitobacter sp.]
MIAVSGKPNLSGGVLRAVDGNKSHETPMCSERSDPKALILIRSRKMPFFYAEDDAPPNARVTMV